MTNSDDYIGAKMCPACGGESKVVNSRTLQNGDIFRRRECLACMKRYNTIEKLTKYYI